MIIQAGYGPVAYNSIGTSTIQRQDAKSASAIIAGPAKNTDQVTLSSAGRALAANVSDTEQSSKYDWLSRSAHELSEPAADKLAHDMSYAPDGVLLSLNDSVNGPSHLANSNKLFTGEDKSYFEQMSSKVRNDRINIYENEKGKGTSPAEIMDKILSYNKSLPERYKELSGWV